MSSVAVAAAFTVAPTVAPFAGEPRATKGAAKSLIALTETAVEPTLPAASYAFAVRTWLPLPAVRESQL